ncbi:metal ABC transporter substrate-binding protein [Nocardioides sp. CER19]|uniref:metal ABC transporter substrate-binding protein n=1 Tax=Nocardioides sp. CER19 TaxID=3038538 RepID=UPI00244AB21E|nr:metal ABC transporter substrate-binding protein [Nocardioides sp. CER19]MDH2415542.1 metal ABC transporter substrate-binding protein [Nocardioides sp. CER19]
MLRTLAVVAVATAALTGCAAFSDAPSRPDDGEIDVVTAFYPLQFVAERVGGDLVNVSNLTQPGQEPHDLELSPKQTGEVALADLVVYEKGLQAAVDAAVRQSGAETVDAAAVAGLEPMSHGGHDDVDHHGSGETVDEEGHDHGDLDPHLWQDPLKLAKVADAVADRLATLDPSHASTYRSNAEALDADLTALDRDYTAGLADCERKTIVVSHNAFGYLTRYGIDIEPIAGLSPDAEPTPADLGRLHDLIESHGITTVFGERLVPAELAETLAKDLGVTTAVLDPIEGLTDETAHENYLSLMRANLAALKEANGCR